MKMTGLLPALGVGMVAGAALGMALKPKDQAMLKQKAGQAAKAVGDAVTSMTDAMHMN